MGVSSTTRLGKLRQSHGFSALTFAGLLRGAGCDKMTEMRLFRIEGGRLRADQVERETICRLLDLKGWEIGL